MRVLGMYFGTIEGVRIFGSYLNLLLCISSRMYLERLNRCALFMAVVPDWGGGGRSDVDLNPYAVSILCGH